MSQGVKKNGATLESNKTGREVLPIPGRPQRSHHIRREGRRQQIPTNRAAAPAQGRAQRAPHPDGRCRLRSDQPVWRPLLDAEYRAFGR